MNCDNKFVIVTDSCCDLPNETAKQLGLEVIPLSIEMADRTYRNYLDDRDIPVKEFYEKLRLGETATTAAPNPEDYRKVYEKILNQQKDILVLSFSSALSSTCNNSMIAATELSPLYPKRRICVVDTLSASLGQGLLVYLAAIKQQKGKDIDTVKDWVESNKLHLCHWFTVDSLNHLKRGGRISPATALLGTVLSIKPVLHVDNSGCLIPVQKIRGRRASLNALISKIQETAIDAADLPVFISHGDCIDDARYVAAAIRERLGIHQLIIHPIGPVIGAHSGPGTLAVFFLGSNR